MKKNLLSLLLILLICASYSEAKVKLSGTIGKYPIEMELFSFDDKESPVRGRYNYQGKTSYLDLKGELLGMDVLFLTESWKGKESGSFFLEPTEENTWTGKWVGLKSTLEVSLTIQSGDLAELRTYTLKDYSQKTNTALQGTYVMETWFVSDLFYTEDNRNLEIVFNGGVVTVEQTESDQVVISLNTVSGPTYHIATFGGTATWIEGNKYEFKGSLYGGEEPCHLVFDFGIKSLQVEQLSSNIECGFGARAYAGGSFTKVKDEAMKGEDLGVKQVLDSLKP